MCLNVIESCRANRDFAGSLVLALFVATAVAQDPHVGTTAGDSFSGELQRITEAGDAIFATDAGERTVALDSLTTWGQLHDTADGTQVLLADGSVIVAGDVRIEGESLVVAANLLGEVEGFSIAGTSRLPLNVVKAIVFRVPLRAADRDALFQKIEAAKGNEDQLWLANGDVLTGTVTKLQRDRIDENQLGPLAIGMKTAAGDLEIRSEQPQGRLLEKVTALVFNPLLLRAVRVKQPHRLVGLADGSRLFVRRFTPDGEQVTFDLLSGVKLQSHEDINIWRKITFLQTLGPEVTYLSDLTPASYRHTPLLQRTWPLGVDRSVTGGRLRSGGRMFWRGLGMHSRSQAVFAVDPAHNRFEAELAIDETAGERGSVVFRVAIKKEGKFQFVDEPRLVRGGDPPVAISMDITGASGLALIVEDADYGTQLDRANWLNARLVK